MSARVRADSVIEIQSVDDLEALEGLVERIFGARQRAPGWFRRKLIREGIEARLSGVAIDRGEACGLVLVGTTSVGPARGSMIGVAESLRGRGVGRALIDFASARVEQLEFLCEAERLDWYLRQGFAVIEEQVAMCASGLGLRDDLPIGAEAASLGPDPVWSWLPEIWTRTPAHERAYLELDGAKIWLSREGRAWLAQRLEYDGEGLHAIIEQLRHRIACDTPLLLYPCKIETPITGFVSVQRSFVVRKRAVRSHCG